MSYRYDIMDIGTMDQPNIFKCAIKDLGDLSINRYLLVTSCTHKISNNVHTMELETEVVTNG